MQVVGFVGPVLHELQRLELGARGVQALDAERARFDAVRDGVARDLAGGGGAGCVAALVAGVVGDGGGGEGVFTVGGG